MRGLDRWHGFRPGVVVVVLGVRHGRHRCHALRAAHGPAEWAALCTRARHHTQVAPAAPASHGVRATVAPPPRSTGDCRSSGLRLICTRALLLNL